MLSRLKIYWQRFTRQDRRLLLILSLLLLAGIILNRALGRIGSKAVPASGGEYVEGLAGSPQHINPVLSPANDVDEDLARAVYAGLYKFDSNLNLVPDLAEALPEVSGGGKEYTVKLRENLFWQDGVQLTADDALYTIQTVQSQKYQSPLRQSWIGVSAAKLDERTIKITTREATSPFVANLTLGLIPKHVWETVPAENFALSKFNLEPVGAGPFQVAQIKRGRDGSIREIRLKPHSRYHGEGPYLRSLVFKFYESADALIAAYQAREVMGLGYVPYDRNLFLRSRSSLRQFLLPLPQYQAVFINRAKNPAPLEDVRVRLALAKSVDKQKIITGVYGGQSSAAYGPILPGHLGYHEQIPGADMNIYDEARAKALLDEAGWIADPSAAGGFRKDKQGRIITLELATNNFPPNVRAADLLKKTWEAIGIQIILKIETNADLESKFIAPRNYELLLHSLNVGADPDPYPNWHSANLRSSNYSTFNNKQADKLLVEARGPLAAEERARRYRQFQEIFVGDVPAVFLTRGIYVYNISSKIQGVNPGTVVTPAGRFTDIAKWYTETKRVKK